MGQNNGRYGGTAPPSATDLTAPRVPPTAGTRAGGRLAPRTISQGDVARARSLRSRDRVPVGAGPHDEEPVRESTGHTSSHRPRPRSRLPVGVDVASALWSEACSLEVSNVQGVGGEPEAVSGSAAAPPVPANAPPPRRTGSVCGTSVSDEAPPKHTSSEGAFLRSSTGLPPARGSSYVSKGSSHTGTECIDAPKANLQTAPPSTTTTSSIAHSDTLTSLPESGDAHEEVKEPEDFIDIDVIAPASAEGFYFGTGAMFDLKTTDFFEAMQAAHLASLDPSPRPSDGEESDAKPRTEEDATVVMEIVPANEAVTAASSSVAQSASWSGRASAVADSGDAEGEGAGDDSLVGCDLQLKAVAGGLLDPAPVPPEDEDKPARDCLLKGKSLPTGSALQNAAASTSTDTTDQNKQKLRRGREEAVGSSDRAKSPDRTIRSFFSLEFNREGQKWKKMVAPAAARKDDTAEEREEHSDLNNDTSAREVLMPAVESVGDMEARDETRTAPVVTSGEKLQPEVEGKRPTHRTINDFINACKLYMGKSTFTKRSPPTEDMRGKEMSTADEPRQISMKNLEQGEQSNVSPSHLSLAKGLVTSRTITNPHTPNKVANTPDSDLGGPVLEDSTRELFSAQLQSEAASILASWAGLGLRASAKASMSPKNISSTYVEKVQSGVKKNPVENPTPSRAPRAKSSAIVGPVHPMKSRTLPAKDPHPRRDVIMPPRTNFLSGAVLRAIARSSVARYTRYSSRNPTAASLRLHSPKPPFPSLAPYQVSRNAVEKSKSSQPSVRGRVGSLSPTSLRSDVQPAKRHSSITRSSYYTSSDNESDTISRRTSLSSAETFGPVIQKRKLDSPSESEEQSSTSRETSINMAIKNDFKRTTKAPEKMKKKIKSKVATHHSRIAKARPPPIATATTGTSPRKQTSSCSSRDSANSGQGINKVRKMSETIKQIRSPPQEKALVVAIPEKTTSKSKDPESNKYNSQNLRAVSERSRPGRSSKEILSEGKGIFRRIPSVATRSNASAIRSPSQPVSGSRGPSLVKAEQLDDRTVSSNRSLKSKTKSGTDYLPRYRPTLRTPRISSTGEKAHFTAGNETTTSYRKDLLSEIRAVSRARVANRPSFRPVRASFATPDAQGSSKKAQIELQQSPSYGFPATESLHGLHEVAEMLKKYMALAPTESSASAPDESELVSLFEAPTKGSIPSVSAESRMGSDTLDKTSGTSYDRSKLSEEESGEVEAERMAVERYSFKLLAAEPELTLGASSTDEEGTTDSETSDTTLVSATATREDAADSEIPEIEPHFKVGQSFILPQVEISADVQHPSIDIPPVTNPNESSHLSPPPVPLDERIPWPVPSTDKEAEIEEDTQSHTHGFRYPSAMTKSLEKSYVSKTESMKESLDVCTQFDSAVVSNRVRTVEVGCRTSSFLRNTSMVSANVQTQERSEDNSLHSFRDTSEKRQTKNLKAIEFVPKAASEVPGFKRPRPENSPVTAYMGNRNTALLPILDASRKLEPFNASSGSGLQTNQSRVHEKPVPPREILEDPSTGSPRPWKDFIPEPFKQYVESDRGTLKPVASFPDSQVRQMRRSQSKDQRPASEVSVRRAEETEEALVVSNGAEVSEVHPSENISCPSPETSRGSLRAGQRDPPVAIRSQREISRIRARRRAEIMLATVLGDNLPFSINFLINEVLPDLRETSSSELLSSRQQHLTRIIADGYLSRAEELASSTQNASMEPDPQMLAYVESMAQRVALLHEDVARSAENTHPP